MSNFLNLNIKALKNAQYNDNWISSLDREKLLESFPSKKGPQTCKVNGNFICSKYDPLKEAMRFVQSQNLKDGDCVVLYGSGLGYHFKYFLDKVGKSGKVLCIETNLSLLKTALTVNDYSKELSLQNFKIISGTNNQEIASSFKNNITREISTSNQSKVKLIIHETSFKLIPEKFNWIKNSLEIINFERRSDSVFDDIKQKNLISNLKNTKAAYGVNILHSIFKDYPVIFAGAGPSLDKNLTTIKQIQKQAFIVCVDTAFIPLIENGINPDFIVSVDPQEKSIDNFMGYMEKQTALILLLTSSRSVVKNVKGPKFYSIQQDSDVSIFFENKLDGLGITAGGSAVSVIGADIVMRCCTGPVIFTGMDFSFPDFKSYANKTPEFNTWNNNTSPYMTLETMSMNNIFSRKIVFSENYNGKKDPTFQSMKSYLHTLESLISHQKRGNVYNYNPKGSKIKHTSTLSTEEDLNKLLPTIINKSYTLPSGFFDNDLLKFCENKLQKILKQKI